VTMTDYNSNNFATAAFQRVNTNSEALKSLRGTKSRRNLGCLRPHLGPKYIGSGETWTLFFFIHVTAINSKHNFDCINYLCLKLLTFANMTATTTTWNCDYGYMQLCLVQLQLWLLLVILLLLLLEQVILLFWLHVWDFIYFFFK
jgi:hypothetical protein